MKKKIIIGISVLIAAFGIYNLVWFFMVNHAFSPFFISDKTAEKTEEFSKDGWNLFSQISSDGYTYTIKKPDYLSFTGNLCITPNLPEEDSEETVRDCTLLIWINPLKENVYGLMLPDDDGVSWQIYVDKDGTPVFKDSDSEKYRQEVLELLDKNAQEVELLFERTEEKWGII